LATLAFAAIALWPCASGAQSDLSGSRREILASQYLDENDQHVSTLSGKTWFSPAQDWRLGVKLAGEWIRVLPSSHSGHDHNPADPHAGHHDPGGASGDIDAVSGASVVGADAGTRAFSVDDKGA
jgi:hypothetical protein